MIKACCVFGQRSQYLPWGYNEESPECGDFKTRLRLEIDRLIKDDVTVFYSSMSDGVELIAAEVVNQAKAEFPQLGIQLISVLPYEGQAVRWTNLLRERYYCAMSQADDELLISNRYNKNSGCSESEQYRISHSTHMILVEGKTYHGMHAIVNAGKEQGLVIITINMDAE